VKVVIAGGGSAGHVFPALALADDLRRRQLADVTFVGSPDGQEAELVPPAGYAFHAVRAQKLERSTSFDTIRALVVAARSVGVCRGLVADTDVVVGIGGYVSAPAVLAVRHRRTKIVLVEPNAVPGLANRLLARRADALALTFEDARGRFPSRVPTRMTGNPVREAIRMVRERRRELSAKASSEFGLDPARRTIVVFGGSQGARALDRVVAETIPLLGGRGDLQMFIASGRRHVDVFADVDSTADRLVVRVVPFVDRMDLALAVADVAVSRSGAGHIAELTACGVPAILVPYPYAAENHQQANARELARVGAAEVISEGDLSPEQLAVRLSAIIDDEPRRRRMSEASLAWGKPDAATRLADLVAEVSAA